MSLIAPPHPDVPDTAADQRARLLAPSRFLGRQPVIDAHCGLFGYELMLRPERMPRVTDDPEQITREAVDHWLLLIPDPNQGCAFVRCTRAAIADRLVTLLPPENTFLVIPADLDPDPLLLQSCQDLRQLGYRVALDHALALYPGSPFLDCADLIRIDFPQTGHLQRRALYRMADPKRTRFLAQNIDAEVQMRIALAEGCFLFQGNFICQPVLFASRSVPQNSAVYLSLLGALHRVPSDLHKVEKLISADPSLCFRVLRLANSALHGHPGIITSVREALLLLGDDTVRRLVTVAMAGALAAHRAPALLSMALARARFCELLAPAVGEPPSQLSLLGILSLLDMLLETSLDRILRSLPISPEMKSALTGDPSPAGRSLALIRHLEACEWTQCEDLQHSLGLAEGAVASFYVEALRWASLMMGNALPV
ncbi:MAG TPA: HDOD domain-containing protein [Acidobacteriaceae bacterium]|jgi:EAL and modified HD-GYP domain-containing signal transduction protein|nr:HDOD domain-containing protein [Acidobacteriaceae bacterium]